MQRKLNLGHSEFTLTRYKAWSNALLFIKVIVMVNLLTLHQFIYIMVFERFILARNHILHSLFIWKIQITKLWALVIAMFQKSLDQCVAEKNSSELIKAKHRQCISSPRLDAICTIQHLLLLSFAWSYLSLSTGRQSYLQRSINALVLWLLF